MATSLADTRVEDDDKLNNISRGMDESVSFSGPAAFPIEPKKISIARVISTSTPSWHPSSPSLPLDSKDDIHKKTTTCCRWAEGLRQPSLGCYCKCIEAVATPIELAPLLFVCGHAVAVAGSGQVLHEDSASSPFSLGRRARWHGGRGWRRGTSAPSPFSGGVGHECGLDL
uniref:Uncharacterized protein n=1 Tax=Oryza meridionalis TaxID=40149 RepID=A0A0E0EI11_9ORYZ